MSSVLVLCPSGHSLTIPVTPNMTILSILETVCSNPKASSQSPDGTLKPDSYSLRHHRKVLDISSTVHFEGLPNKAGLELIPSSRLRVSEGVANVVVQLEDGTRLPQVQYDIFTLLKDVYDSLSITPIPDKEPVFLHIRTEVMGMDAFTSTALKDIGVTPGGRFLLRFFHKKSESAGTQAGVFKEPTKKSGFALPWASIKGSTDSVFKKIKNSDIGKKITGSSEEPVLKPKYVAPKPQALGGGSSYVSKAASKDSHTVSELALSSEPILVYLDDDQSAVAFEIAAGMPLRFKIPAADDDFFEHGVSDIQLLHREQVEAMADSEMLMTSAMRKAKAESRKLEVLNRYRKTVVRIQFPEKIVLQLVLLSGSKVQDLKNELKKYLSLPNGNFEIFITPPKTILKENSTLLDEGLVPASVVYFNYLDIPSSPKYSLNDSVMSKLSNYSGAEQAFIEIMPKRIRKQAEPSSTLETTSNSANKRSTPLDPNKETKVPKWFKGAGK